MEVVFCDKKNELIKANEITGFYGDVLDLVALNINIQGIVYDEKWTVKKFISGSSLRKTKRVDAIFKYLEINPSIMRTKLGDLSRTDFKFVLLAKALLLNKDVIIFDYFDYALAYKEQKRLLKIIRNLKKDGKTMIIVSKNLEFMEKVVDSIYVYKDDSIVYNDSIEKLSELNLVPDREITKFIKLANKKGANLDYTLDSRDLLKDIYRSVK